MLLTVWRQAEIQLVVLEAVLVDKLLWSFSGYTPSMMQGFGVLKYTNLFLVYFISLLLISVGNLPETDCGTQQTFIMYVVPFPFLFLSFHSKVPVGIEMLMKCWATTLMSDHIWKRRLSYMESISSNVKQKLDNEFRRLWALILYCLSNGGLYMKM